MTPAQLSTFKSAILAESPLAEAVTANDHAAIAAYFNADHASLIGWRPIMTAEEIYAQVDWSEMVLATVAQRDTLSMFLGRGSIQSGLASVRSGIAQIIPAGNTRNNLTAAAKRPLTRVEALFFSGTGTSVSPANVVFAGPISPADVSQALSS